MELVSVIVPVYKVEKYLRECVDSILSSTYTNLEVILVDDGSPDGSPKICDEYAQKDRRVRVIHQENGGLCAARNAGLNIATGTYIGFVDSDDVISPFMYEELVKTIETENADWAACESTRNQESLIVNDLPNTKKVHVLTGLEQQLSILTCAPAIRDITWASSYVWNKLYRRSKITKPFQTDCINIEDLQFNWDYIQNSEKIAVLSLALYLYRVNEESITEVYRSQKANNIAARGISIATVYLNIAENTPACYPDLKEYLFSRAAHYAHGAIWRIHASGSAAMHSEYISKSRKLICRHFKTIWKDPSTYPGRARYVIAAYIFAYPLWRAATKFVKLH